MGVCNTEYRRAEFLPRFNFTRNLMLPCSSSLSITISTTYRNIYTLHHHDDPSCQTSRYYRTHQGTFPNPCPLHLPPPPLAMALLIRLLRPSQLSPSIPNRIRPPISRLHHSRPLSRRARDLRSPSNLPLTPDRIQHASFAALAVDASNAGGAISTVLPAFVAGVRQVCGVAQNGTVHAVAV